MDTISQTKLADRLTALADEMLEVGTLLDYYGGFADSSDNGRKLAYAAQFVKYWADEIKPKIEPITEQSIRTGTLTKQWRVTRHKIK